MSLSVQSNSKDWGYPWSPRQSFATCVRSIRNQLGRTNGADELCQSNETTEQHTPIWEGLGGPPNRVIWACGVHASVSVADDLARANTVLFTTEHTILAILQVHIHVLRVARK
jgi:hypothetical protein